MTTRAPAPSLQQLLQRHHRLLRAAAVLRHALRAAAAIAVADRARGAGRLAARRSDPAVAGLRLALVAGRARWRFLWIGVTRARRASPAVRSLPRIRRAALSRPALAASKRGGSRVLGRRSRLAGAGRRAAPRGRPRARRRASRDAAPADRGACAAARAVGAAAVLLVALTLASPSATRRSWNTLFDPARAAPPVSLSVEPGSVRLAPGAALSVRARVARHAPGAAPRARRERPWTRPPTRARSRAPTLWRFDLPPITRADHYRVRVAATSSPRYAIALVGRAAAGQLRARVSRARVRAAADAARQRDAR